MDKLLEILIKLGPLATTFAPGAGALPEIALAVGALLKYIHDQTGMTTDEILTKAGLTLDENEKMLLEDQAKLGP